MGDNLFTQARVRKSRATTNYVRIGIVVTYIVEHLVGKLSPHQLWVDNSNEPCQRQGKLLVKRTL